MSTLHSDKICRYGSGFKIRTLAVNPFNLKLIMSTDFSGVMLITWLLNNQGGRFLIISSGGWMSKYKLKWMFENIKLVSKQRAWINT